MPQVVYAGLCLSSHVVGTLATATIDHIELGPLLQPVLTPLAAPPGQFRLQIYGDTGPTYLIETSADLLNWTTALASRPAVLPITWTEGMSNNVRFYRAVLTP